MGKVFFGAIVVIASLFLLTLFAYPNKYLPSVSKEITLQNNFDQTAHITTKSGSGSGVLINPWAILTACHVVVDNECDFKKLDLKPVEGIKVVIMGRMFVGTVTKFDPYSDLAYVELNTVLGATAARIDPVTVSCEALTINRDLIYGIGYPMSMEKNIKSGVISAIDGTFPGLAMMSSSPPWAREQFPDIVGMIDREHKYFTLFDITLLPGNSGGGIFDKRGHLIGITSHIIKHPEKITPQAGPNSSLAPVPSGYTAATKPQRICEFLNTVEGYLHELRTGEPLGA